MARSFHICVFALLFLAIWLLLIGSISGAVLSALPGAAGAALEALDAPRAAALLRAPDALFGAVESRMLYASGARESIREPFAALQAAQGKNETRNFLYIKDREGFLYRGSFYQAEDARIPDYAKTLRRLRERLPEETALLFVGAPPRYVFGETPVSDGYPVDRQSGRDMDALLLELFANGVDTLDLAYGRTGAMPRSELFYKTDSGWTTEGAFAAFQAIAEALGTRYGLVDPGGTCLDRRSYAGAYYPDFAPGDLGRSVGTAFGGKDGFTYLVPAFETVFSVEPFRRPGDAASGAFEAVLSAPPSDGSRMSDCYLGGAQPLLHIQNLRDRSGPAVLLIGDSSFAPVGAFLAAAARELTVITPGAEGAPALSRLLAENAYDAVVVGCRPESVGPDFFRYFGAEDAS